MRMNVRVANAAGDLRPTPGVAMQEITVADTAVGIGGLNALTSHVFVSWDGADIRLRIDGGDPVGGTTGHLLANGGADVWSVAFARSVKLIRNAGTSATLRVTEMTL